jgi:RNA polymerase sigma-70 factor (ECF subfamily)
MVVADVSIDLIHRAQAGEGHALVRLVEAYQAPVYSLALALMRDTTEAADMTQETFVRVLRSIGSYRGDGPNFWSWVRRLTVNVCLDALRRRRRSFVSSPGKRAYASDTPLPEPASGDVWEQPEWRAQMQESALEVRIALAHLPRRQREALTLHYFEDRSYDEIAATMGVPLNTVKSHILRGKGRMFRLMNGRRFHRATSGPRIRFAAAA